MIHFMFPAFFAGMVFLAVPILLHRWKQKPEVIRNFPSFFFLRKTSVLLRRRNTLIKYLVLFLRCLALILLMSAFAWPYVADVLPEPKRATVILLDSSFSMENIDTESLAAKELQEISPASPAVVASVAEGIRWSGNFTSDRAALRKWIGENGPTCESSSFRGALAAADAKLSTIRAREKRVLVISDSQRVPWENFTPEKYPNIGKIRYAGPPWKTVRKNLALTGVKQHTPFERPGQELRFSAEAVSYSPDRELFVFRAGGFSKKFELAPYAKLTIDFSMKAPAERKETPAVAELVAGAGNEIKCDDRFYFVISPVPKPDVILAADAPEFLPEALAVEPVGDWEKARKADLLILADLPENQEKKYEELVRTVTRNGGAAVLFWNNTDRMERLFNAFGFHFREKNLPGTFRLENIPFDHPILRDYLKIGSGSWFEILFFRVPRIAGPPEASVLASFSGNIPAWFEQRLGKGRLFVFAARPGRERTNWQTFGNFLPFWRELAAYSRRSEAPPILKGKPGHVRINGKLYAVNPPPRESNTASLDRAPDFSACAGMMPGRDNGSKLQTASMRKSPWRWLLLGALCCFLAELALANRTVR